MVGVTEHPINESERVVIATAYTENSTDAIFSVKNGWNCRNFTEKQYFDGSETKVFVFEKKV